MYGCKTLEEWQGRQDAIRLILNRRSELIHSGTVWTRREHYLFWFYSSVINHIAQEPVSRVTTTSMLLAESGWGTPQVKFR